MRKKNKKHNRARIVLRLPDLDHSKSSVLNSLSSPRSRRNYGFAMDQFISWYCSEPRLALNRTVVLRFRLHLESLGLAAATINQRLAAVRRLAYEAADSGNLGQGNIRECGLVRGAELCPASGTRAHCTPRSPSNVRQAMPLKRRRTRANPVSSRTRLCSDNGTLSRP